MKKNIVRLISTLVVGLALVYVFGVVLNWLVDPYGFYDTVRVENFNAVKPSLHKRIRQAKAIRILDEKPRQLILGTSRSEYGLAFAHPGWGSEPPFNASIPAGNIYEAMRFMQHAAAAAPPERVVVSLDFFAFNAHVRNKLGGVDEWMGRGTDVRRRLKYADLFAFEAIAAAWKTLRKQGDEPRYWADLGVNDAFIETRIGLGAGHRQAFRESAGDYLFVVYRPPPKRAYSFQKVDGDELYDTLACFRVMLQTACGADADIHLFLSPSHAWQLELIRTCGLWEQFEEWKRQLVQIAGEVALAAGRPPLPVWDFFTANSVTTEAVPPAGDTETRMKYSLDGSHFSKPTGEWVLDRMFAKSASDNPVPEDFGAPLVGETLEAHLAASRQAFEAWRRSVPDDMEEIATLWQRAQKATSRREVTLITQ